MSDTGFKSPTDIDAVNWTNPTNAFLSDNVYAGAEGAQQAYKDFSFIIPSSAVIVGIEVEVEGQGTGIGSASLQVTLSWDGGSTYTSNISNNFSVVGSDITNTYGGPTDLWGRAWVDTEFSNTNFRLRSRRFPLTADGIDVDHIQVKVYYTGDFTADISVVSSMVI